MKHFVKIPSLGQIMFVETFCLIFLTPFVSGLINNIRPGRFGAELDWEGDGIGRFFCLIDLALSFRLLREIFRPKAQSDSWFNLKTASSSDGDYSFCGINDLQPSAERRAL